MASQRSCSLRYDVLVHALSSIAPSRLRRFRRVEYEQLAEGGLFRNERVELLYGQIVEMSPHGRRHAYAIEHLTMLLVPALSGRASVRVQLPFAALDDSEPEPDVAIVPVGESDTAHPSRAHLIIEVADSSLADDRDKRRIYAAAGVPEYWFINLVDDVVERYTDLRDEDYGSVTRHERTAQLALTAFSNVIVPLGDIVPSR